MSLFHDEWFQRRPLVNIVQIYENEENLTLVKKQSLYTYLSIFLDKFGL